MRARHDFVCFVFVLYYIRAEQRHVHLFGYQRDCKETVMIIYHIFLVYCELNMQEWVSIHEICECDIGAPDIHRFFVG